MRGKLLCSRRTLLLSPFLGMKDLSVLRCNRGIYQTSIKPLRVGKTLGMPPCPNQGHREEAKKRDLYKGGHFTWELAGCNTDLLEKKRVAAVTGGRAWPIFGRLQVVGGYRSRHHLNKEGVCKSSVRTREHRVLF